MDTNENFQPVESEQLGFVDQKYRFKLDNFEGPLDLLLHLIKDAKLDIMTVKLSEITEQYLEYMQDLDSIDMDRASEFITVAATLLEIKSKHLLPVETEEVEDEEDSEALLLQRLKEYEHDRIIKDDINEEMVDKISNNLLKVKKNDMIYVKYYEDGYYKELQSKLKKFEITKNQIELEKKVINLSDIFDLDILDSN